MKEIIIQISCRDYVQMHLHESWACSLAVSDEVVVFRWDDDKIVVAFSLPLVVDVWLWCINEDGLDVDWAEGVRPQPILNGNGAGSINA